MLGNHPPLSLQWLPYIPGSPIKDTTHGNLCIVSSLNPNIEIWDLDMLNSIQPKCTLKDGHKGAVPSIALHPL